MLARWIRTRTLRPDAVRRSMPVSSCDLRSSFVCEADLAPIGLPAAKVPSAGAVLTSSEIEVSIELCAAAWWTSDATEASESIRETNTSGTGGEESDGGVTCDTTPLKPVLRKAVTSSADLDAAAPRERENRGSSSWFCRPESETIESDARCDCSVRCDSRDAARSACSMRMRSLASWLVILVDAWTELVSRSVSECEIDERRERVRERDRACERERGRELARDAVRERDRARERERDAAREREWVRAVPPVDAESTCVGEAMTVVGGSCAPRA